MMKGERGGIALPSLRPKVSGDMKRVLVSTIFMMAASEAIWQHAFKPALDWWLR